MKLVDIELGLLVPPRAQLARSAGPRLRLAFQLHRELVPPNHAMLSFCSHRPSHTDHYKNLGICVKN